MLKCWTRPCVTASLQSSESRDLSYSPTCGACSPKGGQYHLIAWPGASGWPVEQVRRALSTHPSVEWDDQGRLVGFGLTLRPTPHKFTFEGRSIYGWCATDALMFPVLLNKAGIVESVCPATRTSIRVEVTPDGVRSVDPAEAVVSEVRPNRAVADVRAEMCHLGHFFSSRDAAAAWFKAYPEGMLNTVAEDFEIHRRVLRQLGWNRDDRRR